jgi:hypothetical protein
MKISLRQTGGITGGDHLVDLDGSSLSVSETGVPLHSRKLSSVEAKAVRDAARRLMSAPPAPEGTDDEIASDSVLTEVGIDHARTTRRFRVRSGDDAPPELWELVGALSDAAKPR